MDETSRLSNASDYAIADGKLCPFCGEMRQIEKVRAGWLCVVCSKIWAALPGKYRGCPQ